MLDASSGRRGRDGDDWKCRSVLGRLNAGVGGIASRISCGTALLVAGVSRVRPRLLGLRFGGEGGFTKAGDAIDGMVSAWIGWSGRGRLVVDAARPVCREVSTAKFFRFRPFRAGGCFCSSKNAPLASSDVRGRNMVPSNVAGGGDSGEDPGDGSVALESSTVDTVVVGDESFDPDVIESLML